jgi:hypothetical protein
MDPELQDLIEAWHHTPAIRPRLVAVVQAFAKKRKEG